MSLSLKGKMTVAVSLLMAGILSLMAFAGFRFFEREFRATVARQQLSLLAAVAREIDDKLASAQGQVVAVAAGLTPDLLQAPEQADRFLQGQRAVLQTFDNGLFLFSAAGTLLAGTPMEPHMRGQDYSFRDYFRQTAATGRPFISKPFISVQGHGHPILMITAPILGPQGTLIGVLAGSLDLLGKNFLGRLTDARVDGGGYLYLFDRELNVLLHPDPRRILQEKVPSGQSFLERAREGYDGSWETVNADGVAVLSTVKRLDTADWVLGADFPLAEAHAPIRQARRVFLLGQLALVAFALAAVWLFMRHLTAPLVALTDHLGQICTGGTVTPVPARGDDEIGVLAQTFNKMLACIEEQQQTIGGQKDFAEKLLLHSAAPIFVLDRQHRVLFWNRACEELTGLKAAEVKGTDRHWQAFYQNQRPCLADFVIDGNLDRLPSYYVLHAPARLVDEGLQAEGWRLTRHGRMRYMIFSAAPIRDSRGEVIAAIETLEDITERKEAEKRMEELALFDPLTGLANRHLFQDRLNRGIAEAGRYGHRLALFYLDLDGFKVINDTAGHDGGDRALVEVASRLQECVRSSDTVARIGGDEFTIILTRVTAGEDVHRVADRVLQAMGEPVILDGRRFSLGGSIGISLFPNDGADADTLLKKADLAMYRIKAEGKNRYTFYGQPA